MTAGELFYSLQADLRSGGIEDADFESIQLFQKATGLNRTALVCCEACEIDAQTCALVQRLAQRRLAGEPLQYILEEWDFCDLTFQVGKGVLIPRPETELLVACADRFLQTHKNAVVYDLCAGSGAIGLTVAKHNPDCFVYLFEKYDAALDYLHRNLRALALENATILHCDIFSGCPEQILRPDVLLSNPPYICSREIPTLQKEVQYEPVTALDGGEDGLLFYRCIGEKWIPMLNPCGTAVVECGDGQSQDIITLFQSVSHTQIPLYDLNHIDRAVQIIV